MRRLWPALIAIGVLARLWLWWTTIGSNDVIGWANHADHVGRLGLAETYRTERLYNHPPLAGLYSVWALATANHDVLAFARLLKLPALLGEVLAMVLLARHGGARLAALYALLPAPILVAAYHGNTDTLYAALTLLAALLWDRGRHGLAGLAMAAALNVKLIPLVLVPLFVLSAPSWGALARLSLGLALAIVPYVPPLLSAGEAMYRNMVAYNSSADEWGFLALLNDAERSPSTRALATPLREAVLFLGRYLIMGGAVVIALASRLRLRLSMLEQTALASSLFLFFAPGFGIQYVAFPAPLLLAVSTGVGVFWGVASGVFAGALYGSYLVDGDAGDPWYSSFRAPFPGYCPELGVIAWAGLGAWIYLHLRAASRGTPANSAAGPTDHDNPADPGHRADPGQQLGEPEPAG
ncbi:MAG: glycosyltransferase 87 family protein [Planctomycetota bacterium]